MCIYIYIYSYICIYIYSYIHVFIYRENFSAKEVGLGDHIICTGVSSGIRLTSWGEGVSLALVGHHSSDGVTIKMPYGVDILHRPALHPIFSYWVG